MRNLSFDLSGDMNVTLSSPRDVTVAVSSEKDDVLYQGQKESTDFETANGDIQGQYRQQQQQQLHLRQKQKQQQQHLQQQQQRRRQSQEPQETQFSQRKEQPHQHHQKPSRRRSNRAESLGETSADGSFTNFGFIGDILSGDAVRKQQKTGQFIWSMKRKKRAKRIYMRNYGRRVDFHSRYLFPCSYIIFNVVYWSYYLVHS
ncbi:hypothetical protein ElyMa_005738400 [Elysia marginata]|uniref:Neurotransmitter-gated ion-channel transmembrane domain-containing protein n=1 Tax=Elysia marginata TaxID=1093978 RepID=A0AAV4FL62_9GAST|nr:hypothetical protein ElyMa_005738400 [Elysia marginata]